MNWSKLPLTLRVALILELVVVGTSFAIQHTHSFEPWLARLALAQLGLGLVVNGLLLYGTFELSKLLVGRASTGARIAMFGTIGLIVVSLISLGYEFSEHPERLAWIDWLWFATRLAVGVGFALAASRKPIVAIVGLLVWLVAVSPIPPLQQAMFKALADNANLAWTAMEVIYVVVIFALAWFAVDELPENFTMPDPQAAKLGLVRISRAMTLRLLAFAALPLFTMFLVVGGNPTNIQKTLAMTSLAANAVMLISFVMLGFGALDVARSHHPEVRRGPFIIGAIAALWCGGVLLHQAPELYRMIDSGHSNAWGDEYSFAKMFMYVLPLVACAGVAITSWAIGRFALRRNNLELAARGDRAALLVVVMQLLSMGTTAWLLPEVRSTGSFLLVMLMALTFGLIAIVVPGRLARDAAAALVEDAPPEIPGAQLL